MFKPRVEGTPCEDGCGGKNVKSPKTGKVFCENKCWLNTTSTPQNAPEAQISPLKAPEKPNWDKISFGKCKYGFMIELLDTCPDYNELEVKAEDLAKRAMRVKGEPEIKQYTDNIEVTEQPY